ncbi:hypothetical protein D5F11_004670 [Siminovitchia terrae]|uniref:Uncharacterized protein n=1 Tax=Siminovitchia terrae TaxID=1914933 RepID=A0A429XBB1_SIMTE|nr:hypothetical protein [Siminovitchia terrae]RST60649.1 hypothetical protein D5F11_004670 [Siminovitchia terrae]
MLADVLMVEDIKMTHDSKEKLINSKPLLKDTGSFRETGIDRAQEEKVMEEYDIIQIQGKHGLVKLHVPKREPTQEEIDELYRTVAEVAIDIYFKEEKAASKK